MTSAVHQYTICMKDVTKLYSPEECNLDQLDSFFNFSISAAALIKLINSKLLYGSFLF